MEQTEKECLVIKILIHFICCHLAVEMSEGEAQRVTHGDGAASLQVEPVGKLVDDGAAGADLSLHLPVTQRLVLQEKVAVKKTFSCVTGNTCVFS